MYISKKFMLNLSSVVGKTHFNFTNIFLRPKTLSFTD